MQKCWQLASGHGDWSTYTHGPATPAFLNNNKCPATIVAAPKPAAATPSPSPHLPPRCRRVLLRLPPACAALRCSPLPYRRQMPTAEHLHDAATTAGPPLPPMPTTLPPAASLESVRNALVRLEDTILFSLIERANHPANAPAYAAGADGGSSSFLESFVRETERLHAKAGRYHNPEEIPFFPFNLSPSSLFFPSASPSRSFAQFLHPPAASANVSQAIWDAYVQKLLPLIAAQGDDGNYAVTAFADLACLQALSRRIHLGRFVAEAKFREAPQQYSRLIRAKDTDALMKLLTVESVEEAVKRRVERKAMVFGQNITSASSSATNATVTNTVTYKVDPRVAFTLYDQWVIPLTKDVEVDYLLRRLDH